MTGAAVNDWLPDDPAEFWLFTAAVAVIIVSVFVGWYYSTRGR